MGIEVIKSRDEILDRLNPVGEISKQISNTGSVSDVASTYPSIVEVDFKEMEDNEDYKEAKTLFSKYMMVEKWTKEHEFASIFEEQPLNERKILSKRDAFIKRILKNIRKSEDTVMGSLAGNRMTRSFLEVYLKKTLDLHNLGGDEYWLGVLLLSFEPQGYGFEFHRIGRKLLVCYEGRYFNGDRHGLGREYNTDGMIIYEGQHENGYRHGYGIEYNDDGHKLKEGQYVKGEYEKYGINKNLKKCGVVKFEKIENLLHHKDIIGQGGTGSVIYKVKTSRIQDPKTLISLSSGMRKADKFVAVKIILVQDSKHMFFVTNGIMRMRRIMQKLRSRYFLSVGAAIVGKNTVGYVTEICPTTMEQFIAGGRIEINEKIRVLKQVCLGMRILHSKKIMHRDLKWSKILLTQDLSVKIAGLTYLREDESYWRYSLNYTKENIGSIYFMAPEILSGVYDQSIDVFSFGIMIYALLFECKNPFQDTIKCSCGIEVRKIGEEDFCEHIQKCKLRPHLTQSKIEYLGQYSKFFVTLMNCCWDETPSRRPTFVDLVKMLGSMTLLPDLKKRFENEEKSMMKLHREKDNPEEEEEDEEDEGEDDDDNETLQEKTSERKSIEKKKKKKKKKKKNIGMMMEGDEADEADEDLLMKELAGGDDGVMTMVFVLKDNPMFQQTMVSSTPGMKPCYASICQMIKNYFRSMQSTNVNVRSVFDSQRNNRKIENDEQARELYFSLDSGELISTPVVLVDLEFEYDEKTMRNACTEGNIYLVERILKSTHEFLRTAKMKKFLNLALYNQHFKICEILVHHPTCRPSEFQKNRFIILFADYLRQGDDDVGKRNRKMSLGGGNIKKRNLERKDLLEEIENYKKKLLEAKNEKYRNLDLKTKEFEEELSIDDFENLSARFSREVILRVLEVGKRAFGNEVYNDDYDDEEQEENQNNLFDPIDDNMFGDEDDDQFEDDLRINDDKVKKEKNKSSNKNVKKKTEEEEENEVEIEVFVPVSLYKELDLFPQFVLFDQKSNLIASGKRTDLPVVKPINSRLQSVRSGESQRARSIRKVSIFGRKNKKLPSPIGNNLYRNNSMEDGDQALYYYYGDVTIPSSKEEDEGEKEEEETPSSSKSSKKQKDNDQQQHKGHFDSGTPNGMGFVFREAKGRPGKGSGFFRIGKKKKKMKKNFYHKVFFGYFRDGVRNGKGKEYDENKEEVFSGIYLDGKKNGRGDSYDPLTQKVENWIWEDGVRKRKLGVFHCPTYNFDLVKDYLTHSNFLGRGGNGMIYTLRTSLFPGIKIRTKYCALKLFDRCRSYFEVSLQETNIKKVLELISRVQEYKDYIVTVCGIVKGFRNLGILMELCKNSIDAVIESASNTHNGLIFSEKLRFLKETTKGMIGIHQAGIIHRDLKWGNVLIDSNNRCRITDFDSIREDQSGWRMSSKVYSKQAGEDVSVTTTFVPPEFGSGSYTRSFDVYSFGLMMYTLIMEQNHPFVHPKFTKCPKCKKNMKEILDRRYVNDLLPQHVKKCGLRPYVDPEEFSKRVPLEYRYLIDLMTRCWSHDPQKRPTFTEVLDQLENMSSEEKALYSIINVIVHDDEEDSEEGGIPDIQNSKRPADKLLLMKSGFSHLCDVISKRYNGSKIKSIMHYTSSGSTTTMDSEEEEKKKKIDDLDEEFVRLNKSILSLSLKEDEEEDEVEEEEEEEERKDSRMILIPIKSDNDVQRMLKREGSDERQVFVVVKFIEFYGFEKQRNEKIQRRRRKIIVFDDDDESEEEVEGEDEDDDNVEHHHEEENKSLEVPGSGRRKRKRRSTIFGRKENDKQINIIKKYNNLEKKCGELEKKNKSLESDLEDTRMELSETKENLKIFKKEFFEIKVKYDELLKISSSSSSASDKIVIRKRKGREGGKKQKINMMDD